jgi:hypothetical protein
MPKIYFMKLDSICDFSKFPEPAIKNKKSSWKTIDKYYQKVEDPLFLKDNMTIRHCPAISDSVNFGYIVYLPFDIFIDTTNDEKIFWKNPGVDFSLFGEENNINLISYNNSFATQEFVSPLYHKISLKINTLWGIKTDPGYSVWITSPVAENNLPFKVIDAVVDTDKFFSCYPYSILIKKNFKGVIKEGTPLLQVIPFKRENFTSMIIEKDLNKIHQQNKKIKSVFINGYKKFFWSRKRFL